MKSLLVQSPLFRGIEEKELAHTLSALKAVRKTARAGDFILRQGDAAGPVGILVQGSTHVQREDVLGNRAILAQLCPGDLFAESFAFSAGEELPVGVQAKTGCEYLLFQSGRLLSPAFAATDHGSRVLNNMMRLLAEKNLVLNTKLQVLEKRTTRGKVVEYLSGRAPGPETPFTIPFNRQELADYLCVDRSALSAELSRMERDGLLSYERSRFVLHRKG